MSNVIDFNETKFSSDDHLKMFLDLVQHGIEFKYPKNCPKNEHFVCVPRKYIDSDGTVMHVDDLIEYVKECEFKCMSLNPNNPEFGKSKEDIMSRHKYRFMVIDRVWSYDDAMKMFNDMVDSDEFDDD